MMDETQQTVSSGLRLILASASPRRRELVALLGLPFVVVPSRYEEPPAPDTPTYLPDFVTRLAANKAREVAERMTDEIGRGAIVLGADTLVIPDDADTGVPLGKPLDAQDARRMLRRLSGKTHRVYTGIALVWMAEAEEEKGKRKKEKGNAGDTRKAVSAGDLVTSPDSQTLSLFSFLLSSTCTRVRFREMSDTMIADYVATGEPLDKAGAYGAQGYAAPFIESFEGDFFNVVGLPLCAVGQALETLYPEWWRQRRAMPPLPG